MPAYRPARLKAARRRAGLTGAAVAVALDIDPRSYRRYEEDSREPGARLIGRLAAVLRCSVDDFYE